MNEYEMSFLASDHSKQLLAEAEQHRLARPARGAIRREEPARARAGRRFNLHFLFGKTPAQE
ncbi:MAG: hypothetical protein ACC726_17000 [Chloroflexota bacterium]